MNSKKVTFVCVFIGAFVGAFFAANLGVAIDVEADGSWDCANHAKIGKANCHGKDWLHE